MAARFYTLFIVSLFLSLTLASPVWAAKIKSVKGKKVLIDLEGDAVEQGQIYSVIKGGKAIGVIKIGKIKNNQGLAVLGKGKAEPGLAIKLRSKKKASARAGYKSAGSPSGESFWGVIGGFNNANAEVKLPSTTTVELSGTGFSVKGLFDYKVMSSIWFRGMGGLEQFNVSGSSASDCGGTCEVKIGYIAFDLWGRFMFSEGTFRPWVGGGGALLFPMSKDSSAISEKSITNTNIFAVGGGFDFFLSDTTYIPVQVEYDLYPESNTVSASALALRAGFAVPF